MRALVAILRSCLKARRWLRLATGQQLWPWLA